MQILDTNIPLQILVDNIQNDIFWKKCYISKWSDIPIEINDKSWITIFMERHYADFLEHLNPRHYDPEKVIMLNSSFYKVFFMVLFNSDSKHYTGPQFSKTMWSIHTNVINTKFSPFRFK